MTDAEILAKWPSFIALDDRAGQRARRSSRALAQILVEAVEAHAASQSIASDEPGGDLRSSDATGGLVPVVETDEIPSRKVSNLSKEALCSSEGGRR